jgi:hypothetical protein
LSRWRCQGCLLVRRLCCRRRLGCRWRLRWFGCSGRLQGLVISWWELQLETRLSLYKGSIPCRPKGQLSPTMCLFEHLNNLFVQAQLHILGLDMHHKVSWLNETRFAGLPRILGTSIDKSHHATSILGVFLDGFELQADWSRLEYYRILAVGPLFSRRSCLFGRRTWSPTDTDHFFDAGLRRSWNIR